MGPEAWYPASGRYISHRLLKKRTKYTKETKLKLLKNSIRANVESNSMGLVNPLSLANSAIFANYQVSYHKRLSTLPNTCSNGKWVLRTNCSFCSSLYVHTAVLLCSSTLVLWNVSLQVKHAWPEWVCWLLHLSKLSRGGFIWNSALGETRSFRKLYCIS